MQSDGKVDVMGKLVAYFKLQLISLTTYFLFFFFTRAYACFAIHFDWRLGGHHI